MRCPSRPWHPRRIAGPMRSGMIDAPLLLRQGALLTAFSYRNGSVLIASLQPRFTILHNLAAPRMPSPVVTLAWHASSSRQKSDMLATQTHDGDLRVWSIAKSPTSNDTAKVIRILRRSDNSQPGPNWLGWSKNGRIVQYSEG